MHSHYKSMSPTEVVVAIIFNLIVIPSEDRLEVSLVSRFGLANDSIRAQCSLRGKSYEDAISNLYELSEIRDDLYDICLVQALADIEAYQRVVAIAAFNKLDIAPFALRVPWLGF